MGCIQYRLPVKSLGNFLHRSWKMGAKKDPGSNSKSFLLHFEEDKPFLHTLKSKYNVPLKGCQIPTDAENSRALTAKSAKEIKVTHEKLAKPFEDTAKFLIKDLGEVEALSRALFLLNKQNVPGQDFTILPKSAQARVARKEKIQKIEAYVARK